MIELKVLQAVRLKGRVSSTDLAATLGEDPASIAETVEGLIESGLLITARTLKLSATGRDRLGELLATERAAIDQSLVANAYNDFRDVNVLFKALITDWQLRDGQPNTHADADYDASVIERLHAVHAAVVPIIDTVGDQLPRLTAYRDKLTSALGLVDDGDTTWLTRPIVDSYHTVWFELHEELILAAGLTRHDEAQAGHAH